MMIDLVQVVLGVLVITYAGSILLNVICQRGLNGYLRVAISFVLGNLVMVVFLSALALFDALEFAILALLLVGLIDLVYFVVQTRKNGLRMKFRKEDTYIVASILVIIVVLLVWELLSPLDEWDTRAIWLIKAKAFFLEGGVDNIYLTHDHFGSSHRGYPNGLSLMMALFFRVFGAVNEQAVKLYLITFYLNIVLLVVGAIKIHFTKVKSYVVVLFIIAMLLAGKFVQYAAVGYADIPLSLAVGVSMVCMVLAMMKRTTT